MSVFIVLLRAIGPVTHKVMSMAQWRDAVAEAGFDMPETYVATGNMIVGGEGSASSVARRMDTIIFSLGLAASNKAIVRTPRQLQTLLKADPFPDASAKRPSAIGVYFFAVERPDLGWVSDYSGPERIHVEGKHLIVDYDDRASNSRLPGLIEKRSGAVTARNWNTVRGLVERAKARQQSS